MGKDDNYFKLAKERILNRYKEIKEIKKEVHTIGWVLTND
jgi:hypothetical protein